MKSIPYQKIVDTVADMSISSCSVLTDDVYERLQWALDNEESPVGKAVLEQIIENDRIAREETVPMCQDTGIAVFFVELGDQVQIEGNLTQAITDGVIKGYKDGYLRKSMVEDPLDRKNTGDNSYFPVWSILFRSLSQPQAPSRLLRRVRTRRTGSPAPLRLRCSSTGDSRLPS
jgi:fumarate hydratase subunit alpha